MAEPNEPGDPYAGSKKKARLARRERQRSQAFTNRLGAIMELAQAVTSEAQLDVICAEIDDLEMREEVRKLIRAVMAETPQQVVAVDSVAEARRILNDVPAPLTGRKVAIRTAAGAVILEQN